METIYELMDNKIKDLEKITNRVGTLEDDCDHDIVRLYTKDSLGYASAYTADYCKKCAGVY